MIDLSARLTTSMKARFIQSILRTYKSRLIMPLATPAVDLVAQTYKEWVEQWPCPLDKAPEGVLELSNDFTMREPRNNRFIPPGGHSLTERDFHHIRSTLISLDHRMGYSRPQQNLSATVQQWADDVHLLAANTKASIIKNRLEATHPEVIHHKNEKPMIYVPNFLDIPISNELFEQMQQLRRLLDGAYNELERLREQLEEEIRAGIRVGAAINELPSELRDKVLAWATSDKDRGLQEFMNRLGTYFIPFSEALPARPMDVLHNTRLAAGDEVRARMEKGQLLVEVKRGNKFIPVARMQNSTFQKTQTQIQTQGEET